MAHLGATRALSESEQPVFEAACKTFSATLCPYVSACYDRIFPNGSILIDSRRVCAPITELAMHWGAANTAKQ